MKELLFPVLLVSGIGLILGVILAVVSSIMYVPKNEKIEKLEKVLPGANCGACGYSGCSGYAQALFDGKAKSNLCAVGGEKTAKAISEILGTNAGVTKKKVAIVKCQGDVCNTQKCMDYDGIQTCAAVAKLCGNNGKCSYSCIGLGDCMKVCPFGAINICGGVAVIDEEKCKACGKCIATCPKNIIKFRFVNSQKAMVCCSNKDSGADTRKACISGCLGCMRCVKECEQGAIKVENNLAVIDAKKCIGCGKCAKVCKPGAIVMR